MTAAHFIKSYESLSAEDKRRVLTALGPQFVREMMCCEAMMRRLITWCCAHASQVEVQNMLTRIMGGVANSKQNVRITGSWKP